MKSRSLLRLPSVLLIIVLLAGCGGTGPAAVSSSASVYDSTFSESDVSSALPASSLEEETAPEESSSGEVSSAPEGSFSEEVSSAPEESEEDDTIRWTDLIRELNGADPAEFETLYTEAMEKIERQGLAEDWASVCRAASAYLDYAGDEYLFDVGENYRFYSAYGPSYPDLPEDVYFSNIRRALDADGLDTPFMERIYTPGNKAKLSAVLWPRTSISKRGYPETAPAREDGDPIRVLVVYLGDTVIVDREGIVTFTPSSLETAVEDVTKLWDQFFAGIEGASLRDASFPPDEGEPLPRVQIVGDPDEADVILRYDLEYPLAGAYGLNGQVSVYNCHVQVSIRKADDSDYLRFTYEHNAGETVTARSGSANVWIHIPSDIDNEIGTTILSWFPDV